MHAVKEKAQNVAASAKSGMEKTKATAQEKAEKVVAHNDMEKQMATEKDERKNNAEARKQEAHEHNCAAKETAKSGH